MELAQNSKERGVDRREPASPVVICSGGRIMAGRGMEGCKDIRVFRYV